MQKQNKLSARILSLALSTAMVFTSLSATVFAAEGAAPLDASDTLTAECTITAFDELGEGFLKSDPFDGYTYVRSVELNTPFEELGLPTKLGVTVERTTTVTEPAATEPVVTEPVVTEPAATEPAATEPAAEPVVTEPAATEPVVTEPVAEPAATEPVAEPAATEAPAATEPTVETAPEQLSSVTTVTEDNVPVTWTGDSEYTPAENSKVVYTAVLPEGYALADGVKLPQINVMVGKQVMAAMPRAAGVVTRTIPLDLTKAGLSYVDTNGATKTADPTTADITDTKEGWSWNVSTKTLALDGATIDCSNNAVSKDYATFGILVPDATIITLNGTSTVASGQCESMSMFSSGVESRGSLTINGGGKLITTGFSGPSLSNGIYAAGIITIENVAELIATGGNSASNITNTFKSSGIRAGNAINITNSTVSATSGTTKNNSSFGIYSGFGGMKISSSTVSAKGIDRAIRMDYGKITAVDAKVGNANEAFTSGTTTFLTQKDTTKPVVIRFGPTKRTEPLDLASYANVNYIAADGTSKSANPMSASITDTDEGWSWDNTSKTLTLSGANIDCSGNPAKNGEAFGIQLTYDCTIVLADGTTNIVKAGASSNQNSTGIYFPSGNGTPTISGTGTLHATGGDAGDYNRSSGIACCDMMRTITVKDATVYATSSAKANIGAGIAANLNVESGTITATGTGATFGYGIYTDNMTMSGGNVTAIGQNSTNGESYGAWGQSLNMTGGKMTAAGKTAISYAGNITANTAMVTGAKEKFVSGKISKLTQRTADPVVIRFGFTKRTTTLDLTTNADITYIAADGTSKSANPTTASINDTDEGWSWDHTSKTLTLSGANIDCSGNPAARGKVFGIKLNPNCHIVLADGTTNIVKAGSSSDWESHGVYFQQGTGSPSISGTGTLDVTGGAAGSDCASSGISCENFTDFTLTIKEATINAASSEASIGAGIGANLNIESGTITATGKAPSIRGYAYGINGNTLNMTGGTLFAYGKYGAVSFPGGITAVDATVTNGTADNGSFVSGTTKILKQINAAEPVKINFIPKVFFDARNGEPIVKAEINGGTVTKPEMPMYGDYSFGGWYTGIDGTGDRFVNEKLTSGTKFYACWIKDGKAVRTEALDLTANPLPTNPGDQGWTWDAGTSTLTLNGLTLDCSGNEKSTVNAYGIHLPIDATISLTGESINTVKSGDITGDADMDYGVKSYGVGADGNVTITGTGTLNTIGGAASETMEAKSYGIRSEGNITINGGIINATGSTVNAGTGAATSAGIYTNNDVTISEGATVNATSGDCVGRYSKYAVGLGASTLEMTGGVLNGISSDTGVSAWTSMTLSGTAVVTGKGTISAIESGNIIAVGATATGTNDPFNSGAAITLTQTDPAIPVKISFGPSITVAAQSGTATYSTEASPTFAITNSSFGGRYPAFAPKFEWVGTAPTGVTPTITGSTLTVKTTAATPAGEYKFKVVSPKADSGNYESAEVTLKVDKLTATITWGDTVSFTYNGSAQAPTATVSNKIGSDEVTVTVTGEQTNVSASYTAAASTLTGTAAGNYALPSTNPTKAFAITAKEVTVNDGDLEVKKAFDNNTNAGTVTSGKLGLTGVVAADTVNVSVKVDTVGAYADSNVGKNKTVTLTISLDGTARGNYALGSTSYSFAKAEITKVAYTGTQASAPEGTPTTRGDKSITIKPVTPPDGEAVEYAVSTTNTPPTADKDWQPGTTFDKLNPNTEYFFFARVKESDSHAPGSASAGTSITTDRSDYTGTQAAAPNKIPDSKTVTSITLKTVTPPDGEAIEYGIEQSDGTIAWKDTSTFSSLFPGTLYKFYTRVKENGTHKAGTTSDATTIKTKTAPVNVSGTVKDNNVDLDGATVILKRGSTEVKRTTTANGGSYTLTDVPEGVYSLVITKGTGKTKITITEIVTVAGTAITGKNIEFLAGNKNTVVESTPNTPEVAVGGMNDLLNTTNLNTTLPTAEEQAAVAGGGSVELKFTANLKTSDNVGDDKDKIEGIASSQKIDLLLDLSVLKTVKDSSDKTVTDGVKVTKLASIIEVHLPIPAKLQGKAGLQLYRMHDGKAEKLKEGSGNAVDGEYYTIDPSETFMTLYLKKFSTYAMGYNAFTVTVSGGGTGASGKGNYSSGEVVTINAGTKSNYIFDGWTVTPGTVTLANPSDATTTFVMPADAVTVTAGWTYTGGGSSGGAGGGSSGGNGEYEFWMQGRDKIDSAKNGDVIKLNLQSNDKMPASVMDALRKNPRVSLIINWNGGKTITIPAGKAAKQEDGRIYYPLSLLAELYAGYTEDSVLKSTAPQNPQTGGPGKLIPAAGGELITLEAPAHAITENAQANTVTPPNAGFEADAFVGTPDERAARGTSPIAVAAVVLLLAAIGGGWVLLWKRDNKEQE